MTVEELRDEIEAIDAIYPDSTEEVTNQVYNIILPQHRNLQLQLSFPSNYPDEIPSLVQVVSHDLVKYADVMYLEGKVGSMLQEVFVEGVVCIFELLTMIEEFLEEYDLERKVEPKIEEKEVIVKEKFTPEPVTKQVIDYTAGWLQLDPVLDRGSTFIGFARACNSVEEAKELIHTLTQDRKIARATHNINSWRIKQEGGIQFQDCDDDGEAAAGGRLLHLLTVCIHEFLSLCSTNFI